MGLRFHPFSNTLADLQQNQGAHQHRLMEDSHLQTDSQAAYYLDTPRLYSNGRLARDFNPIMLADAFNPNPQPAVNIILTSVRYKIFRHVLRIPERISKAGQTLRDSLCLPPQHVLSLASPVFQAMLASCDDRRAIQASEDLLQLH